MRVRLRFWLVLPALLASASLAAAQAAAPDSTPRDRFMATLERCAHRPAPSDTVAADPALRRELLAMVAADQRDREFTRTMGAAAPPESQMRLMMHNDSARTARLRQIVREDGWPTAVRVGWDGANAAFLVLQHATDPVFQALMLPEVQDAYRRGELEGQSVALLTDRVRAEAGLRQRYGMQPELRDGRYVLGDVEDVAGLPARRAELCVLPVDVYHMMMEEMYGLRDHGVGLFQAPATP
ncbi:DUF6624 domain-containing protein [Longimicrobium terrae]|uniref:Uncharacterized protein n=1 Tax=Longimicrobium terrae TaxID=1639882 RepID=A0A841GJM8_9BACT|nr:DUF6624 domain-containing protein [Longimicrobium terrae]MBB4634199.1 hypothetical protein [Longimicrobium terrae]MBB6068911.1 hypothetical protein [Longimicrobium terrae]NNC28091.1 hypothetical protein [Longimicrobium terrae]